MDSVVRDKVFDFLKKHDISFECHEHPAVATVEEALRYSGNMGDVTHCKNLFLRNRKGTLHYLVIMEWSRKLDIHCLEKIIGEGRLSFASAERMKSFLGVAPGSLSLFGVLNDTENAVVLILDSELESASKLSFHPNDNTATIVIDNAGFHKFLKSCGNKYEFITLDKV